MNNEPHARPATDSAFDHPAVKAATSISAALIALGAATAYFVGYVQRDLLFRAFGLDGAMLEEPVQSTIARGYLWMVVIAVPFVTAAIAIYFVVIIKRAVKAPSLSWAILKLTWPRISFPVRRSDLVRLRFMQASFGLLTFGFVFGGIAGSYNVHVVLQRLEDHCSQCYLYTTAKGQVIGTPLGQDKSKIVIATVRGTYIVDATELRAVRSVGKIPDPLQWLT